MLHDASGVPVFVRVCMCVGVCVCVCFVSMSCTSTYGRRRQFVPGNLGNRNKDMEVRKDTDAGFLLCSVLIKQ